MDLILLVLALLVAVGVCVRLLARAVHLPCPFWLSGILEMPMARRRIGPEMLLERAGIARGMRVLDAGCGAGRVTVPAAERVGPEGEVTGLDLQAGMLRKVRARAEARGLTNIRTVHAPVGTGAIEASHFDRALIIGALGEFPNPREALTEIHRALVPGGLLSITEMLPDPHYQTRRKVRRLAEASGFRFRESFGSVFVFTINFEA